MSLRLPWVPQPATRTPREDSGDVPTDSRLVEVELPDGSTIWCLPEAADQWRPEVWRAQP